MTYEDPVAFGWAFKARIDMPWTDDAACRGVDGDLFFPERGASTREAKAVCARCPVRVECLEYALEACEKHGVWGGTSERERRRLRRDRVARLMAVLALQVAS